MKKILIILFLLPLISYSQKKVIETADFYGYDFKDNYIEKIEKVESWDAKFIWWRSQSNYRIYNKFSGVFENKKLKLNDYSDEPIATSPFGYSKKWDDAYSWSINLKDEHLCSYAENYKYFTRYLFGDNYTEINYGFRLLKPDPSRYKYNSINTLYYKKKVEISDNKTVIENQYSVAVKDDSIYKNYTWLQLDPANYYLTFGKETNQNSLKGKSLKEEIKESIWINIDDKIYNNGDCYKSIPQNFYDKNHIITLNDDFDYSQVIEAGRPVSKNNPHTIHSQDHTYVFTFGLEDPSKDINDVDVENAIEYKITYISNSTNLERYVEPRTSWESGHYTSRRSGSYKLQIRKKFKGVFYFEKTIYSEEIWDPFDIEQIPKRYMYAERMGRFYSGLIKIFRSSDNIYFVLNNNLLDTTKDHYFENNTLLLNSYFENLRNMRWNFRPFNNQITYNKPHILISKTINKRIPLNKDSFRSNSNNWAGNGSGIIISKLGHIVTNNHVIKDANDIEVEFSVNNENKKFKAEVVQVDKINDLAILRIVDDSFQGINSLLYNFKSRSSDVGTKIYTFGYPKALTGMGKEIKVTEGIISSKSGFDGDITKYQITAPIQGGNSGGPLFDDKGNFIGINSSKFNSDETENVNYSIKSSYVMNLIDVLPKSIDLPSSNKLQSLPLTEQIKEISKYVVLVKVK